MSTPAQQIIEILEVLEEDQNFLRCLFEVGVDNWDGIEEAQALYEKRHVNTEAMDGKEDTTVQALPTVD